MNETIENPPATGDVVLQEIWRIKDQLSASYNHDLKKLLALTRENEKRSGHKIVSFEESA
jgi:hypothetical protein